MGWIEIEIETTSEGVEPVTGIALMAGIGGLVVDDPKDIRAYLAGGQAPRWAYVDDSLLCDPDRAVRLRAYVADDSQGRSQWEELRLGLLALKQGDSAGAYGSLGWTLRNVAEEDWANNWKAYFKPFPVGQRLVVKPTWEHWDAGDGRVVVEIDPGSSFGTGQHESTRLCMELMEGCVTQGARLLDIGCGSGILTATGLLLGVGFAIGVDIEEHALRTTEENLRQNGIAPERYALYGGDVASDQELRRRLSADGERADLAVVNIVADVILSMAPYLPSFLKQGGTLIASGVIEGRRGEVVEGLTNAGFTLLEDRSEGEWRALKLHLREHLSKN